jgi:hypothetical protein
MFKVEWLGRSALEHKLARLADPDASPLMEQWGDAMREDNRRGILAGLDKDDNPMPITQRQLQHQATHRRFATFKRTKNIRVSRRSPAISGAARRALTEQDGPPLAPARERSRSIANYGTSYTRTGQRWEAIGFWADVVSNRGIPFLKFHFAGPQHNPRLPIRDLAGIRAYGMNLCKKAATLWARSLLKGN